MQTGRSEVLVIEARFSIFYTRLIFFFLDPFKKFFYWIQLRQFFPFFIRIIFFFLDQFKEFISGRAASPSNISSSLDFSETPLSLLKRKIKYLGLDNIVLVDGDYKETMTKKMHKNIKFMATLVDCDLYESHKIALPFVWDRLVEGGYMYLDEYYSLKFPGARIATDEFFVNKADKPEMYSRKSMDFERWFVIKKA